MHMLLIVFDQVFFSFYYWICIDILHDCWFFKFSFTNLMYTRLLVKCAFVCIGQFSTAVGHYLVQGSWWTCKKDASTDEGWH
jgi:hypothetical protein